jgi:hypothetical protein
MRNLQGNTAGTAGLNERTSLTAAAYFLAASQLPKLKHEKQGRSSERPMIFYF